MDTSIPTTLITTVLIALAGVLAGWLARRPNRVKGHPGRVRMPKIIPFVGWLFLAVGVLMMLVAFLSPPENNPIGMQVASVLITLGGLGFLTMYRNFYVAAGEDEVHFRSLFGREKSIVYSDIVDYRAYEANGQAMLSVRSAQGVKLSVNMRMYALDPLLAAIAFKEQNGRWPLPGEPRSLPAQPGPQAG